MSPQRFSEITARYPSLRVAVLGDFCLDRYLEIDPARKEASLETGLPVYNVTNVRAQPGGAGTIVNNLSALGLPSIFPIGFVGDDGEGHELSRALQKMPGVKTDGLVKTDRRQTFTYCKPLVISGSNPPTELNRLDFKNWTPTPALVEGEIIRQLEGLHSQVDAVIIMDQVDVPETGVVTQKVLTAVSELVKGDPAKLMIADSRRGLRGFPPVIFKMNAAELSVLRGSDVELSADALREAAGALALHNRRSVIVTLGEMGILGATGGGETCFQPALPVRGPIDIVGAGDAVMANLTAALAAGAELEEALELANAAASVVIHKLGTTGTASVGEIEGRLKESMKG